VVIGEQENRPRAAALDQVVNFYNVRFQMNLTPQQKQDLVNFLKTL
jgi:hypothetical protein